MNKIHVYSLTVNIQVNVFWTCYQKIQYGIQPTYDRISESLSCLGFMFSLYTVTNGQREFVELLCSTIYT